MKNARKKKTISIRVYTLQINLIRIHQGIIKVEGIIS